MLCAVASNAPRASLSQCKPVSVTPQQPAAVVPGGAVSVSVYPGHASGARESLAVRALARSLSPSAWRATEHVAVNHGPDAPYVVSLHRLFRDDRENTDDDFAAARAAITRARLHREEQVGVARVWQYSSCSAVL